MSLRSQDGAVSPEQALAHLSVMRADERGMWNVAPREGEFLSDLARKVGARRALEIGTSNGYSGIWIALGLRETGGKLITLEIDGGRHSLALKNFQAAGVTSIIDARLCDALKEIPKIDGPLDFVFIDANKSDYLQYLRLVLPKMSKGGVITAHNVHDYPEPMRDFLEEIRSNPALKTEFVSAGPSGLSVSYVK